MKEKFNECKILENAIYFYKNAYKKNQAVLCLKNKNIMRARFHVISPNIFSNYHFFFSLFYIRLLKMKKAKYFF